MYVAYGHSVDHEFKKYMHVLLEGAVADIGSQPGLQLLIIDGKQTPRCFDRINIGVNFAARLSG